MDSKKIEFQIIGHVALFLSLVSGPWWLTLMLIAAMILIGNFFEAGIWAILYDSLYGVPLSYSPYPLVMTFFTFIFVLVGLFLKPLFLTKNSFE